MRFSDKVPFFAQTLGDSQYRKCREQPILRTRQ
nr:MAG TPA: ATP grasp ligase [Caudoviricetes sp.]